ncbi:MAG: dephospho-CoA kinase [Vescimonas sp.]
MAVLAPAEDRVRRIMARDGISEDYARLRISAQQPDAFYRERCSHILKTTVPPRHSSGIRHGFSSGACSGKSNIYKEETKP